MPSAAADHRTIHPAHLSSPVARYYSDLSREHGYEPLRIEGTLPAELRGTLYRSGPATSQRFGRPYAHVFEGDGAISAVRFGGGDAEGAHRLLRSDGYVQEERAGKALFGSAAPWATRMGQNALGRMKNTGNTAVMHWHGTLYALMENACPIAFDEELTTIGESNLGGVLRSNFSAHPHSVVKRRATYNIGLRLGPKPKLHFYELPWQGEARHLTSLPLRHNLMLHDFMATEQHLVALVSPMRLNVGRAAIGLGTPSEWFEWHPEDGTEVIVVPIDRPHDVRRFRVDPFLQIHFAGGWDEPDAVVVDISLYGDGKVMENFSNLEQPPSPGHLTRIRIPHGRSTIERETLFDTPTEFPRLDPRSEGSRYSHLVGMAMDNHSYGVVRYDMESGEEVQYRYDEGLYIGEPLFVPRAPDADPGDGFVMALVYDSATHTSHVDVFDSRSLADGPVAAAHFDHHIPAAFHGIFVPES